MPIGKCPIAVTLTDEEVEYALSIAILRDESSEKYGFQNRHGYEGGEEISFLGACGELAFCKAIGAEWSASNFSFKNPDHGRGIQIRTSPCKKPVPPENFGNLIIREGDNENHSFVLVVGNIPHFLVKGWIVGRDGKADRWKATHAGRPPAWFVPYKFLQLDLDFLVAACG